MILSKRHKFIFVKGMKVGGTSLEIALSDICGPEDIIAPISPIDELIRLNRGSRCRNFASTLDAEERYLALLRATPEGELDKLPPAPRGYYNHMPLGAIMIRYGKDATGYRVICVERSPYAKVISWANMQSSYQGYKKGGEMRADWSGLANVVEWGFETGTIREPRNIDRYRGLDGKVAVEAMRYGSLAEEFASFVRSLGINDVPPLPHAKKGLLSDTIDPTHVLRPDQITRINQLFAEEFKAFGYQML